MKRKKGTDSKEKLAHESNAQLLWRAAVDKLPLNTTERNCECIVLAEADIASTSAVENINLMSGLDIFNDVYLFTYTDIIEMVEKICKDPSTLQGQKSKLSHHNQSKKNVGSQKSLKSSNRAGSKISKESHEETYVDYLITACNQANPFLTEKNIPHELLAKIIKLHIINLREADVMKRKQVIAADKDLLAKYQQMLIEPENLEEKSKRKSKKKDKSPKGSGKGKDEKKDKSPKGSGKGKDKKKKKDASVVEDFCTKVNTAPVHQPPNLNFRVEFKQLYFILSGIYEPALLEELYKCGISVGCIVQVLNPLQTNITDEVQENTNVEPSASGYSQALSGNTWSSWNSNGSDISIPKEAQDTHANTFWDNLFAIMNEYPPVQFLNNTYFVRYLVKKNYFPNENSIKTAEYLICEEICNLVREINDIRRQYVNYTKNLRLINVEDSRTPIPIRHMKIYNRIMNRIPPECINVPIVMFGLLEEVVHRMDHRKINKVSSEVEIVSEFDLLEEEENDAPLFIESPPHGGVRSQIMNVIRSYQHRHSIYYQENTVTYVPPANLKVNIPISPFVPDVIQFENRLEYQYGQYKKLCKPLLEVNVNALKTMLPVKMWENYGIVEELQSLINNHHLFMWSNRFNVPVQDIIKGIHGIMCKILSLRPHQTDVNDTKTSKFDKYPRKTSYELLEESLPAIQNTLSEMESAKLHGSSCSSLTTVCSSGHIKIEDLEDIVSLTENYNWIEHMPQLVMLQAIETAYTFYESFKYLYFPFTDVLLLVFQRNVNKNGSLVRVFENSLRTIVSLREFCQFIVTDDKNWIDEQEKLYKELRKKESDDKRRTEELLRFPTLPEESDYILKDSLKYRELHPEPPDIVTPSTNKTKNKKGKGGDNKKGKTKKSSSKESQHAIESAMPTSKCKELGVKFPEDLFQEIAKPVLELLEHPKTSSDINAPFIGYDFGAVQRVQLVGVRTDFQSSDAVRVTADSTRWLGTPNQFTVVLSCGVDNIVMHKPPLYHTNKDHFKFHLNLENGSIIVFAKPNNKFEPCTEIMKQVEQSLMNERVRKNKIKRKYQKIFFVEETHNTVLKCFKIPRITTTSQPILMSEDFLLPFYNKIKEIKNEVYEPNVSYYYKTKQSPSKHKYKVIVSKQQSGHNEEYRIDSAENFDNSHSTSTANLKQKSKKISEDMDDDAVLLQKKEMVEKLKSAIVSKVPLYKICSTKLHPLQYVVRAKSHVEIPLGKVIKRFTYKPRYIKSKRMVEVKTCVPLQPLNVKRTKMDYEFRATLPIGLCVQTVPAVEPVPFQIKQYYIEKGPLCKGIEDEEYRMMLHGGHILIKKTNGDVTFLSSNGKILTLSMGFFCVRTKSRAKYTPLFSLTKFSGIDKNSSTCNLRARVKHGSIPLHSCVNDLTTFQKILNKTIARRQKHLLHGPEERCNKSRRVQMRKNKKRFKIPEYLVKTNGFAYPDYTYVTTDGTEVHVSGRTVSSVKNKYYFTYETNYSTEEILYKREDKTSMLLKSNGSLITQFLDGSKIISTPVTESSEIYISAGTSRADLRSDEKLSNRNKNQSSGVFSENSQDMDSLFAHVTNSTLDSVSIRTFQEHSSFITEEGFVSIVLNYSYEHPNFATVSYNNSSEETVVTLSASLSSTTKVVIARSGAADVFFNKFCRLKVEKDKVEFQSTSCNFCKEPCNCTFYVNPLYTKQPAKNTDNFFTLHDSFDKRFFVNYEGLCAMNNDSKYTIINKSGCLIHNQEMPQRMFVLHRDLSGSEIIKEEEKEGHVRKRSFDTNSSVAFQTDEKDKIKQIETRFFLYKTFAQEFLQNHPMPELSFTKDYLQQPHALRQERSLVMSLVNTAPIACMLRILCELPSQQDIEPIATSLLISLKRGLLYKDKEEFDELVEKLLHPVLHLSRHTQKDKPIKDLQALFREKWLAWKKVCDSLKSEAHRTPPNYFQHISEKEQVGSKELITQKLSIPTDDLNSRCSSRSAFTNRSKATTEDDKLEHPNVTSSSKKYSKHSDLVSNQCEISTDKLTAEDMNIKNCDDNEINKKIDEDKEQTNNKMKRVSMETEDIETKYGEPQQCVSTVSNSENNAQTTNPRITESKVDIVSIPMYGDNSPERMVIHTRKCSRIEHTDTNTTTDVTEEIQFTVPKDVVIICENGMPLRAVGIKPKEITILAENKALVDPVATFTAAYDDIQKAKNDLNENIQKSASQQLSRSAIGLSSQSMLQKSVGNKILIMTNVDEETKVLIAKELSTASHLQNQCDGLEFEAYAQVRDKIAAIENLSFTNIIKTSDEKNISMKTPSIKREPQAKNDIANANKLQIETAVTDAENSSVDSLTANKGIFSSDTINSVPAKGALKQSQNRRRVSYQTDKCNKISDEKVRILDPKLSVENHPPAVDDDSAQCVDPDVDIRSENNLVDISECTKNNQSENEHTNTAVNSKTSSKEELSDPEKNSNAEASSDLKISFEASSSTKLTFSSQCVIEVEDESNTEHYSHHGVDSKTSIGSGKNCMTSPKRNNSKEELNIQPPSLRDDCGTGKKGEIPDNSKGKTRLKTDLTIIIDITRNIIRDLLKGNEVDSIDNEIFKVMEVKFKEHNYSNKQMLKLGEAIGHSRLRQLVLEEVALYNTLLLTKLHTVSDPGYTMHMQCTAVLETIKDKYAPKYGNVKVDDKQITNAKIKLVTKRIIDNFEQIISIHKDCILTEEEINKIVANICNKLDSAKFNVREMQTAIKRLQAGIEKLLQNVTPLIITTIQTSTLIDLIETNLSKYIRKCVGVFKIVTPKKYYRTPSIASSTRKSINSSEDTFKCTKCRELDNLKENASRNIPISFIISPPDRMKHSNSTNETTTSDLGSDIQINEQNLSLEESEEIAIRKVKLLVNTTKPNAKIPISVMAPNLLQIFKDHSQKKDIPMYFATVFESKSGKECKSGKLTGRDSIIRCPKTERDEHSTKSNASSNSEVILKHGTATNTDHSISMVPLISNTIFDANSIQYIYTSNKSSDTDMLNIVDKNRLCESHRHIPPKLVSSSKKSLNVCHRCKINLQKSKSSILTIYSKHRYDYYSTEQDDISMIPVLSTFTITINRSDSLASTTTSNITLAELMADHNMSRQTLEVSCDKELIISKQSKKDNSYKGMDKKVYLNLHYNSKKENKFEPSLIALTSKSTMSDFSDAESYENEKEGKTGRRLKKQKSNTSSETFSIEDLNVPPAPSNVKECANCKMISPENPSVCSKISLVDSQDYTCNDYFSNANKYVCDSKPVTSPSMIPLYSRQSYVNKTCKENTLEVKEQIITSTSLGTQTQGDRVDKSVQKFF